MCDALNTGLEFVVFLFQGFTWFVPIRNAHEESIHLRVSHAERTDFERQVAALSTQVKSRANDLVMLLHFVDKSEGLRLRHFEVVGTNSTKQRSERPADQVRDVSGNEIEFITQPDHAPLGIDRHHERMERRQSLEHRPGAEIGWLGRRRGIYGVNSLMGGSRLHFSVFFSQTNPTPNLLPARFQPAQHRLGTVSVTAPQPFNQFGIQQAPPDGVDLCIVGDPTRDAEKSEAKPTAGCVDPQAHRGYPRKLDNRFGDAACLQSVSDAASFG